MTVLAVTTVGLLSIGAVLLSVPAHAESTKVEIANPASAYCVSIGGTPFVRKTPTGDTGYCRRRDGRVDDEWALFRASQRSKPTPERHAKAHTGNPAAIHCAEIGGTNVSRRTSRGDVALCRLRNGKTVDAWALYRRAADGPAGAPSRGRRVEIANPASAHCAKLKGRLELRQGARGTSGYCHLPNGRVVEEWQLFREESSTRPI